MKSILDGVHCKDKHADIVLGPPGTGKTTLVATVLLTMGEQKTATLCVPTAHNAEKLIIMMQSLTSVNLGFDKLENFLLLAKESEIPTGIRHLGIEKIVDQYGNGLLYWKHFVSETMQALRRYNNMYEYHFKANSELHFLDFFKTKVSTAVEDLKGCLEFFLRLPSSSFCYIDAEAITALIKYLEEFTACLTHEEIEEDALKFVLNVTSAPRARSIFYKHGFHVAKEINKKRVRCLAALEYLNCSLKLNKFVTRADIAEHLIMKSKFVIYTPSTPSSLKNILFNPRKACDLLIVDNATRMQEDDLSSILTLNHFRSSLVVGDDPQLLKDEIDMNTAGHLMLKELLSMGFKAHQFVQNMQQVDNEVVPQMEDRSLTRANLQPSWRDLSWIGISEVLLAPVRHQGNTETCAFQSSLAATETHYKLEAHSDNPPRTFNITLCVEDMEKQYEKFTGSKLGSEETTECKNKKTRLENALLVLKERGVLGNSRIKKLSDNKVPIAFRISSFEKYPTSDLTSVCNLLKAEKVMPGYFRLSRNYFTLSSGQAYKYDPEQPLLNPNNKRVRSHAVMFVGYLSSVLPKNKIAPEDRHQGKEKIITELAYQNSYGKLFGENNGFGRIEASSVRQFFLPILEDLQ